MVAGRFELIHSVDSVELAEKINFQAESVEKKQKILLQINQADEKRKTGFQKESIQNEWPRLQKLNSIRICGLMCLPPLFDNPEDTRPYFRSLREQLEKLRAMTDLKQHPLEHLSMGTSHDYMVAIEEGATLLRLGTVLFGERVIQVKGKM